MAVRLTKQSFVLEKVFNIHTYIHTYIHTNFIQDVNKLIYRKYIILKDILKSGQRSLNEMAAIFKAPC